MREVIEINGVKLDVDLRSATRVEQLKVGTRVRLLNASAYNQKVYDGVVIGFEPFKGQPTIIVAYVDLGYQQAEVKFLHYCGKTTDWEMIAAQDQDLGDLKEKALKTFDAAIETKRAELEKLGSHRRFFVENFGQSFSAVVAEDA